MNCKIFLHEHRKEIVDFIEQNQRPLAMNDNIFTKILSQLMTELPMGRDGQTWLDKAHIELSIAIIQSMWCGWLSQAKANRSAYSKEYVDKFKQTIIDAFEIGQAYATERP